MKGGFHKWARSSKLKSGRTILVGFCTAFLFMHCSKIYSLVLLWHCSVCLHYELQHVFFKAVARRSFPFLVKSMSPVWPKHHIRLLLLQNLFLPLFILAIYMAKSTKEGEREWRLLWASYRKVASSCTLLSDCSGPRTAQYVVVNASYLWQRFTFSKGAASCFAIFTEWEPAKGVAKQMMDGNLFLYCYFSFILNYKKN